MNLPPLTAQIAYLHLAWGVVLGGLLIALWPARWSLKPPHVVVLLVVGLVIAGPWGTLSASHWLGLAFQSPSGLWVSLALLFAWQRARVAPPTPLVTWPAAAVLVLVGAVLYLDASGFLSWGLYPMGFGRFAVWLNLAIGLAAWGCWFRGHQPPLALAVLIASALFACLRLPTGNAWDAYLDPLLWLWAVCRLLRDLITSFLRPAFKAH